MTLFFKAQHVLIGFLIATVLLTIATMYPYLNMDSGIARRDAGRRTACQARLSRIRESYGNDAPL